MQKKDLFSDGLPFHVPVWHFAEQVCKPFTSFKQNVDLDTIPDYGGHMFYACPIDRKFEEIKQNNLSNCPFRPKACLLPYRLSATPGCRTFTKRLDSLQFDARTQLLISSAGYSRTNVKLLYEQFTLEESNDAMDEESDEAMDVQSFPLNISYGPIEQICQPTHRNDRTMLCVQQEKAISIISIKHDQRKPQLKVEFDLLPSTQLGLERWHYMFITHSSLLDRHFFYAQNEESFEGPGKRFVLAEHDWERNVDVWKLDHGRNKSESFDVGLPVAAEYSAQHPRLVYYLDGNQVGLIDVRIKPKKSFRSLLRHNQLPNVFEFDPFNQMTRAHLNPNYYLVSTDLNVILADHRYPDRVLLQWNHMLPTNNSNPICSLKSNPPIDGKNVIAVSNSNRTSLLTIKTAQSAELQQPISMHFPLHLPQFLDSYKFSNIVDGEIENYLRRSRIVGFDFVSHEKGFTMFHMSNFGDMYVQDFIESGHQQCTEESESIEPGEYNYKYHSEVKFDKHMRMYLNQNFQKLGALIDVNFNGYNTNDTTKKFVTHKTSWMRYLDENNRKALGKRDLVDRKMDVIGETACKIESEESK